jgi:hypothetical protein
MKFINMFFYSFGPYSGNRESRLRGGGDDGQYQEWANTELCEQFVKASLSLRHHTCVDK